MRKDSPACFVCPKSTGGLHHWTFNRDGVATCDHCRLVLSKIDSDDLRR